MNNLLNFLIKNSYWFVFIFLELICFYFVFNENSYQKSVYLNSSNQVVGSIYSVSGTVNSYFDLKEQNQHLLEEYAEMQKEILILKDYIETTSRDSLKTKAFLEDSLHKDNSSNYSFTTARVINNSISKYNNTITINKGKNDGIDVDMGVISEKGLVGLVRAVSDNRAIVQPILNPDSRFSCKISDSNTPGTLIWEGGDPRYASLTDYPKFEKVEKGDTIITSGFSGFFPEGILVGTVEDYKSQTNDNFYNIRVKLSTDFSSLKDVIIVKNKMIGEQRKLESEVRNDKK